MRPIAWAVGALALGAAGCGDSSDESRSCGAKLDDSACVLEVGEHPIEGADHVADCAVIDYGTNPPSSGTHYFTWGAFGVYETPLPRGFWVHAMEHGAVVFSYREDLATEEDVDAAREVAQKAADPDCSGAPRVILTPDPKLDVEWAASAWGHTLRASCFDAEAFDCFFDAHVGQGPEKVCAPGQDFRNPDGTLDVPAGCGESP
jgi:hypothetical protein